MPVYNVIIGLKSRPHEWIIKDNILKRDLLRGIVEPYNRGEDFRCDDEIVSRDDISNIKITESDKPSIGPLYHPSDQRHFADRWESISQMKDVTAKFIETLPQRKKDMIKEATPTPISKDVFIVHGRDHKPMKELKVMLKGFGLNPVVLHEQASGSRTIVEKLEKYSDVGYAFVLLTPDDMGYEANLLLPRVHARPRARQNVILEFGYFIGKLDRDGVSGRDRVCCLLKGEVERPSDMHGIVYIPFKESVNKVRDKIVKELKAAGYEIKA